MIATAAVIMAAGQSTRMKTTRPKVLHELCGRPMLAYVLDACREAGIEKLLVVVGYGKAALMDAFASERDITWVEQAEQKGTGHAVMMCEAALRGFDGRVVVIAGDMPLVRGETLATLLETHAREGAAVTLATTELNEPAGYGRIIRDDAGRLLGIVEHRDCTVEQLAIREVNPSYYCFDSGALFDALGRLRPNNAKGEYYITDALKILIESGKRAAAVSAVPPEDATGINNRHDLAIVNRMMQDRIQRRLMDAGVTVVDPATTWIDSRAAIGQDTVIEPFCVIAGPARIGAGCRIGPHTVVGGEARVEAGATVAPFTRC